MTRRKSKPEEDDIVEDVEVVEKVAATAPETAEVVRRDVMLPRSASRHVLPLR